MKVIPFCKCGHPKCKHEHNREMFKSRSDCSACKCTFHPDLEVTVYEISACQLYPENCVGICWAFKDSRGLLGRIVDFFLLR